ncbi:hypothetical protein NR798_47130 [Archangium gephyra]|uniref:hypothetical protein n=1 Tax=Archangium gephyra TaxID=48 RepID=UPI0035D4B788
MKNPGREKFALTPTTAHPKKPVEPKFAALTKMPETPEELFRSLALTVTASVSQHDPAGKKSQKKQEYALPWAGFESWRDARKRLEHFEHAFKGKIVWAPFNETVANDGPMSLNAYPGRALIERVTNEGDANLEAKALTHKGPMPTSPAEAVARWFDLGPGSLSSLDDDKARKLAKKTVTVTGFVGDPKDHKDSIFDARDFGIGLTAAEMPDTILSLNRGNKKSKHWLTGKHGQGASSTYQYSDLTLIASRKIGAKKVAFTLVEGGWDKENGVMAKTPTYKYLTIGGKVPELELPEEQFPAGTLVRHIGYNAADLFNPFGENSLYGLLMRSLAEPLFPVWLEMFSLRPSKAQGYPTFPGFRRYGRLIRGTVNSLERAWAQTLKKPASTSTVEEDASLDEDDSALDEENAKILHRASEYFQLPTWDYGARTGVAELGRVKITYWVADPANRKKPGAPFRDWRDVLRNWVDPDKTVIMTLDGQTHAEESRAIVTGQQGAKLWAVGRYMVVQIDCNGLDPRAKYEMFTSTREHAKETPIKKMILEELVRRLSFDTRLAELNVQLAAADINQPEDTGETISSLIKKYLKAAGVSFEQLTRKVEKWTDVEVDQKVEATPRELPPIEAVDPPTFVRWKFSGTSVKMHPGQRYSFLFETDAAPPYWNPEDQAVSKIKVTAHGVRYVGAGEMKGGRVRCHFECPADVAVGTKGFIQVQLEYAIGAAKMSPLPVEIVEKPKPKEKSRGSKDDKQPEEKGESSKVIKVKVRKKDFTEVDIPVVTPQPVKMTDPPWATLGWPHDPHKVGFSIRPVGGKVHLYYNAEFPPFLDLKRKMSKKSLEDEFIRRYQLKLVLHTIFTLNYELFDEDDFPEEQKKRVRSLLCATAESLALATKSEIEIEAKVKSEDTTSLDTQVAADLQAATASTSHETAYRSA